MRIRILNDTCAMYHAHTTIDLYLNLWPSSQLSSSQKILQRYMYHTGSILTEYLDDRCCSFLVELLGFGLQVN